MQGVTYPAVQSLVYLVKSAPLLVVQAVAGALTVGVAALTAWRVGGPVAGWVVGTLLALHGPHVIASGTLTAEAVLITFQTAALWCLVEAIARPTAGTARVAAWGATGGLLLGVTMLRPALQFTGAILLGATIAGIALERLARHWRTLEPNHAPDHEGIRLAVAIAATAAGTLAIAAPWWITNAVAFGQPTWSRTGNSWQQVYWGIYPPNRAWQPQDAPVPPRYGVESLPEARNAGIKVEVRDLDYLDAAIDQVRATPVQAFATMVDKLAGAWSYPWNPFDEAAPVARGLVPVVHPAMLATTIVGLAITWRRPVVGAILTGALLATWLPYLAVNIDVRYVVTPAPVNAVIGGIAAADILAAVRAMRRSLGSGGLAPHPPPPAVGSKLPAPRTARRPLRESFPGSGGLAPHLASVARAFRFGMRLRPTAAPLHRVGAPVAVAGGIVVATLAALGTTGLLVALPTGSITPSDAHLVTGGAFTIVTGTAVALAVGLALAHPVAGAIRLSIPGAAGTGIVAGTTLALLVWTRTWFAPEWHAWSVDLHPGDRATQSVTLPAGWRTPPGSIIELRLWLQGGRAPRYEPVIRVNGKVVANFRPAFDDAGSLRFPESLLAYARLQGKVRADLPQWYAVRLDPTTLDAGRLDVEVEASPVAGATDGDPADAWIRTWGDYRPSPPRAAWDVLDPAATETFEGPALFSRRAGADHSTFKYYATGDSLIWRRTPLRGTTAPPVVARADGTAPGPLEAARLREGTLRMRVVVLDPTFALVTAF